MAQGDQSMSMGTPLGPGLRCWEPFQGVATGHALVPDLSCWLAQSPATGVRGTVHNGLVSDHEAERGPRCRVPDHAVHVSTPGFEPGAACASSRCSSGLSYMDEGSRNARYGRWTKYGLEPKWRDPDSHRGPLGYEPSALLLRHPAPNVLVPAYHLRWIPWDSNPDASA